MIEEMSGEIEEVVTLRGKKKAVRRGISLERNTCSLNDSSYWKGGRDENSQAIRGLRRRFVHLGRIIKSFFAKGPKRHQEGKRSGSRGSFNFGYLPPRGRRSIGGHT